ncbi:MAG TPA: hypothetical protein VH561_12945 [Micromonosporaceae bacterium]|jgi:hypothetical protein
MGQDAASTAGVNLGYGSGYSKEQLVVDFETLKTLAFGLVLLMEDTAAIEMAYNALTFRRALTPLGGVEGPMTPGEAPVGEHEVVLAGKHFKLIPGFVEAQVYLNENLLTLARSCLEHLKADAETISLVDVAYRYDQRLGLAKLDDVELEAIEPMLPARLAQELPPGP